MPIRDNGISLPTNGAPVVRFGQHEFFNSRRVSLAESLQPLSVVHRLKLIALRSAPGRSTLDCIQIEFKKPFSRIILTATRPPVRGVLAITKKAALMD